MFRIARIAVFGFLVSTAGQSLGANAPPGGVQSQGSPQADAHLAQRLEWFKDQKFGLFLHWGIYSKLGCIESWPMVWEDRRACLACFANPETVCGV